MARRISHVVGFDDAPFARDHRGNVLVVGAVFAGLRLEGVLTGRVRRDGANATRTLADMINASRFRGHLQAVLLQGIALAGFNVIDIHALHTVVGLPVLVVARRAPDLGRIRRALLTRVRGGKRKWALIEQAGPMRPVAGVFVQCVGLSLAEAGRLIERLAVNSDVPEPLRTAHIIAGGVAYGESRHRV